MRQIVLSNQEAAGAESPAASAAQSDSTSWVDLQALCCQAAGGDPDRTIPATAAWYLLYAAAHLFDHMEDQDELPAALTEYSSGELLHAVTGLIFSASMALNDLLTDDYPADAQRIACRISRDFTYSVLRMAGGQQRDMRTVQPSIEEWFEIAGAKSGSFFALACRSGARWGTDDPERIDHFGRFGHQLGVILQLRDDITDLSPALLEGKRPQEFGRSLAAAYARSVLPPQGKAELSVLSQKLTSDPAAAKELIAFLDRCGAGLYLRAEIERLRGMAVTALQAARPAQPAGEALLDILNRLCKV